MIVRRRRNHEYKLVRRPARKEDYLAAVQYEVHLDMFRKHRKRVSTLLLIILRISVISMGMSLFILFFQKFGIAKTQKDADNGIQNRIHGLFRVKNETEKVNFSASDVCCILCPACPEKVQR